MLASTLTLTQVSNGHKSFDNSELVKIDWTFGTSCMAVLEEEQNEHFQKMKQTNANAKQQFYCGLWPKYK